MYVNKNSIYIVLKMNYANIIEKASAYTDGTIVAVTITYLDALKIVKTIIAQDAFHDIDIDKDKINDTWDTNGYLVSIRECNILTNEEEIADVIKRIKIEFENMI